MKDFGATMLTYANEVILVHCHPSGDPSPSAKDNVMAEKLVNASKLYQI
jgi:DNA repair protein RadC